MKSVKQSIVGSPARAAQPNTTAHTTRQNLQHVTLTNYYSDSYVTYWTDLNLKNYSCTKQTNYEGNILEIICQCHLYGPARTFTPLGQEKTNI